MLRFVPRSNLLRLVTGAAACLVVAACVGSCGAVSQVGTGGSGGGGGGAGNHDGTTPTPANSPAAPPAKWTVLVYMNAKNSLDPFSLTNFEQMASVPNSKEVNVVVEWGRLTWQHVYRIKVRNGMSIDREPAGGSGGVVDVGDKDMGAVATLDDFVRWGKQTYPASRYMLVIWDHGQGYRLEIAAGRRLAVASVTQGGRVLAAVPDTQPATVPAGLPPHAMEFIAPAPSPGGPPARRRRAAGRRGRRSRTSARSPTTTGPATTCTTATCKPWSSGRTSTCWGSTPA